MERVIEFFNIIVRKSDGQDLLDLSMLATLIGLVAARF